MVRAGFTRPLLNSTAVVRATSARSPTPVALSLAPGSCTCAEYTKRSSGRTAPRISATTVRSGRVSNRVVMSARACTAPSARAAFRESRAAEETKMSQP